MTTPPPPARDLHLVVGYDGSPPAGRALEAAATAIGADHPDGTVVIVVGSSSHAMHRMVGSVAVSLARHSPVPLVVVP
jgi:nucleotide-binding universal stress UspA family protein